MFFHLLSPGLSNQSTHFNLPPHGNERHSRIFLRRQDQKTKKNGGYYLERQGAPGGLRLCRAARQGCRGHADGRSAGPVWDQCCAEVGREGKVCVWFFFVLVLVLVNLPLPDPICAVIPIGWLSVHGIANKYHGYGLAVDTPAGPPGSLSAVDIVTETDFKVEEFIRTTIAKKYPSHG